jgi:glycosyltransferase involved in cell wall biosynthesis
MQTLVDKLWVVPRSRNPSALLSLKPFHYETRSGVKTVALSDDYDAVLLESEFVGGILENPTLRAKHRILRVHNDESYLHRSLATDATSFVEWASFWAESYKFRHYSPQIMKQCDQLWYISDREMEKASHSEWAAKAHHVPVLVDQANFKRPSLASSKVFYVGALSVPINSNGLIWYLKNIHPHLLSIPGYEFILAGKTGSASIEKLLEAVRASERVTYSPDVADLAPLYDSAAAFVNPIQRGAGVKIKTIDAAIAGLPVIATSVGAEGTGFVNGVHAVIADTVEDFIAGVKGVLEGKERSRAMVDAAQQLLAKSNGPEAVGRLLETLA